MAKYQIESQQDDPSTLERELATALNRHNMEATGQHETWPVAYRVRDDDGTLIGGVSGYVWAHWLYVSVLWVHPSRRGRGIGASLLAQAEQFALEKGCRDAYLTTFDFQAPGLYRRHGYRVFGRLEDYPAGHTHYFLHKRLSPAPE